MLKPYYTLFYLNEYSNVRHCDLWAVRMINYSDSNCNANKLDNDTFQLLYRSNTLSYPIIGSNFLLIVEWAF